MSEEQTMRSDCKVIFETMHAALKNIEFKLDRLLTNGILSDHESRISVLENNCQGMRKMLNRGLVLVIAAILGLMANIVFWNITQ